MAWELFEIFQVHSLILLGARFFSFLFFLFLRRGGGGGAECLTSYDYV